MLFTSPDTLTDCVMQHAGLIHLCLKYFQTESATHPYLILIIDAPIK